MTEKNSPLWEHLIELRRRLLYCLWAFIGSLGCSYGFSDRLLGFLAKPLTRLFADQAGRRFIYTSLTEAFITHLKVTFFAACILASPVWAFQIWRFIRPALYRQERLFYQWMFSLVPFLFVAGACLAYFVICPWAWKFFLSFESPKALAVPLQFEAKISEYLGTTLQMMTTFGLGFQLPIILSSLVAVGWVSLDTLRKGRKYAFLLITIIAALLTPPDLISPLGLMIPLYGLYEATLLWLSLILPRQPKILVFQGPEGP